ncbi:unnamed protein product [Staurois parvus]|uniref:Uncharacterized protein n=1 Tax=Staurois parvus TaxID=386267 RepID=A0ABN9FD78_9NEOB|nr:unnamed protein product [Staurois parvus]
MEEIQEIIWAGGRGVPRCGGCAPHHVTTTAQGDTRPAPRKKGKL